MPKNSIYVTPRAPRLALRGVRSTCEPLLQLQIWLAMLSWQSFKQTTHNFIHPINPQGQFVHSSRTLLHTGSHYIQGSRLMQTFHNHIIINHTIVDHTINKHTIIRHTIVTHSQLYSVPSVIIGRGWGSQLVLLWNAGLEICFLFRKVQFSEVCITTSQSKKHRVIWHI